MSIKKYKLMYDIAERVSLESTCPRMQAGSVIFTPDYHIISTGFNGAPHGLPHCEQSGCIILEGHCARSVHAEANAIIQAARMGGSGLSGDYIAVTNFPCPSCALTLLQAGISRIYYRDIAPTYTEEARNIVFKFCNVLQVQIKKW